MKVLIACEESGIVRDAFLARGHDAMSCDLKPTRRPGPHYEGDVLDVLGKGWDMMIAHPVCRYMANSGGRWLYLGGKKVNGRDEERWENMRAGAAFFNKLYNADIPKIVVENPIIHEHAQAIIGVKQSQVIQPWHHGHKEMKATCLWLSGDLPLLLPSNVVGPPPKDPEERKAWAVVHRMPPGQERERLRSETKQGIADAFAAQWG